MSKISITYRATIDRYVPVVVRTSFKVAPRKESRIRVATAFSFLGERMRITT